ncbi:MAG: endonuclease domain-containing protein [Alteraurantiacibacter sp.]
MSMAAQNSSPLAGEEGARRKAVGRRGGKHDLLPLAKRMRREPTEAEKRLWSMLRAKRLGGHKFKRQEQIGDYIVDFVCFATRVIVEADGSQHADNADANRDHWLKSQGFRVLRFWNNEILNNRDGVAQAVLAALETPLPGPLPQGEREIMEQ